MIFDIRGRRRHVVKVVYAILALLMGLSLFLVVGPVNINALFGNGSSSSNAAKPYEEQAERLERKLRKSPEDVDLLAQLTRTRINAGNAAIETNSEGQRVYTTETIQQFQQASDDWSKYLKATKEPNAGLAQVVAPVLTTLAEASGINEFRSNINAAAEAQQIYAEKQPSINSLTTLTIYRLFNGDFAGAHEAEAKALALTGDKFERENVENQMQQYEKRAKELEKQLKAIEKAQKSTGTGSKEQLEHPLGGLGGSSLGE